MTDYIIIVTLREKKEFLDGFLEYYSAKDAYYSNITKIRLLNVLDYSFRECINHSFEWASTKQGQMYWIDICIK